MSFTPPEIELFLLGLATAGYVLAWGLYLRALWTNQERFSQQASMVTGIAFIFQAGSFALRTYRAGHLPIYNAYEFSAIFAGGIVLTHLIFERLSRQRTLGVATLPVAVALLFYAWTLPMETEPILPIFKSFWLKIHVLTAFVAYSSLAATFGASCLYLITRRSKQGEPVDNKASRLTLLDRVSYQAAMVGFSFLTIMIISGAIWAEYVWGRFWSWDPKETWSLITWLIVAAYLHTRYHRRWIGRKAAVLGVVGFLFVLMTFLGVDFLSPRQHDFLLWRRAGQ